MSLTIRKGNPITTFSGVVFWPLDPRESEVRIEDIAHHLSMMCRWTGAVREFWPVGLHSVLVSELMETWLTKPSAHPCDRCWSLGRDGMRKLVGYVERVDQGFLVCEECFRWEAERPLRERTCLSLPLPIDKGLVRTLCLASLLHDGSEAYLIDVPRPLKVLPEFEGYRAIERGVQRTVYSAFGLAAEEPWLVKQADNVLLSIEAQDLMPADHPASKPVWRFPTGIERPLVSPTPRTAELHFLNRFAELAL